MQKSDAGVGIGTLIGDRITLLKNKEIGKNSFHVFYQNEIHIQAFQETLPGNESQEMPRLRLFIISSYYHIIKSKTSNKSQNKNLRLGTQDFRKF